MLTAKWMMGVAMAALFAGSVHASVEISSSPTKNMNCSAGVCSPTAKKAVLNVTDLTNMLASGDVRVTTGNGANTITVETPFSWTSTSRITLDAIQNVSFKAPVTVAGTGAVTITYSDGGINGDLRFFPGAKLDFWDTSSSLIINGDDYVLAKDITSLAANVNAHPVALANDYDAIKDKFHDSVPIPNLRGILEGLGHTIENFNASSKNCVGFVGRSSGVTRDIRLVNAEVTEVGFNGAVGTLVGCNSGLVANAVADGKAHGENATDCGGLVGRNKARGIIIGSHANVSADIGASTVTTLGGLVGDSEGAVFRSSATGTVVGTAYEYGSVYLGGLAGRCARCDQTFATGSVEGMTFFNARGTAEGGLVGEGQGVTNSYATGAVTGTQGDSGGLVASGCCTSASYSLGAVSSDPPYVLSGGFIGAATQPYQFQFVYWDLDTTEQTQGCGYGDCTGVTAESDAQLKSGVPAGFDPSIWAEVAGVNNGYPYLIANPPP